MSILKLPIDVLKNQVASDEEVTKKLAMFFDTPEGINLQAQRVKGVLDDVAYEQQRNRLFSEFLVSLDSKAA